MNRRVAIVAMVMLVSAMISMAADIIDGVVAGRFLQELKRFLENPASLLL